MSGEEAKEADNREGIRAGAGMRPNGSGEGSGPQYLIEADDMFDEQYGEGRLVAPPVLGETSQSYRDF